MYQDAPKLVIMAAGMGSRFGGPKQITPVDANGHILIDFSLYDAWRAGFCPQNLAEVAGFLPFKKRCITPVFRGQIKKRYAHDPTFSLLLRALRTALNPSCNETRRL